MKRKERKQFIKEHLDTPSPVTAEDFRRERLSWYPGRGSDHLQATRLKERFTTIFLDGPEGDYSDGIPDGASTAEFYLSASRLIDNPDNFVDLARQEFASYSEAQRQEILGWLAENGNVVHLNLLLDNQLTHVEAVELGQKANQS